MLHLSVLWKNSEINLKKKVVSLCSTIIAMDNAPIHVSNYSKTKIKDIRLQCLTICPYGPFLNPIKKAIVVIKSRWRRLAYNGKIKQDSSDVHKIAYVCILKLFINFVFKIKLKQYRKTLCLSPPNDQKFSKLRRGLDNGYKMFWHFFKYFFNF